MKPTVKNIVIEYLKHHGFDGLLSPRGDCGCVLDNLAPCGGIKKGCQAAYKVPSLESEEAFFLCVAGEEKDDEKRTCNGWGNSWKDE